MEYSPERRLDSLDILRGLVVLGIFLINVDYFSTPAIERYHPTVHGDFTGLNKWIWILSLTFAKQRFMAIFAVLFGAGIWLMSRANQAKGRPEAIAHYSRMSWLMVLGLIHAYVIWDGDVLVNYAVCGALVYPLRNLPLRWLWILGSLLFVGPMWPEFRDVFQPAVIPESALEWWNPDAESLAPQLLANQGSYLEETPLRIGRAWMRQWLYFYTFTLWRVGGYMLMGMALIRTGFLAAALDRTIYLRVLVITGVVGVAFSVMGTWLYVGGGFDYVFFVRELPFYFQFGSLVLAFAYMCVAMLLTQSAQFAGVKASLAAVGRMAFTNYIVQSVIGTLVFFGYGLGMFGKVDRTFLMLLVLGVWTVQIVSSRWWLARFRFGPLEWVWRSLTYRTRQPFRLSHVREHHGEEQ